MNEIWRPIPTLPIGYEASNLGRVRSWRRSGRHLEWKRKTPLIRKPVPNVKTGYLTMNFNVGGKAVCRYVHHLILDAFKKSRTGPEGRHLNGNYYDNRPSNLRWGTRKENISDQERHGNILRGERNGGAKLTNEIAAAIRSSRVRGDWLAIRYGVSQATISRIRHGRRYKSAI